jgi:hypothetical protein
VNLRRSILGIKERLLSKTKRENNLFILFFLHEGASGNCSGSWIHQLTMDRTRTEPAADTAPDQQLAGEPGKNRTALHQSIIGTVTQL